MSDNRFDDCPWKLKWFEEIKKKMGDPDVSAPETLFIYDNEQSEINPEAEQWIEYVVNIFVSNLIDASGKKLIDKFISNNNFAAEADLEENEL